jgi:hypothetical protein
MNPPGTTTNNSPATSTIGRNSKNGAYSMRMSDTSVAFQSGVDDGESGRTDLVSRMRTAPTIVVTGSGPGVERMESTSECRALVPLLRR